MKITGRDVWQFIQLARPHFMLGPLLLYGLGTAMARFLGAAIDENIFVLGLGLTLSVQLMTHFLNEYFDGPQDRRNQNRTPFSGGSGVLGPGGLPRQAALVGAVVFLTAAIMLASLGLLSYNFPTLSWVILGLSFIAAFFYNMPPIELNTSGVGELTTAITVGGLVPAFAFSLQTGEFHRLLPLTTTPIVAATLAMIMVFELIDYSADEKNEKRTMMVRLGWETGMRVHDVALAAMILSLLIALNLGLPWRAGRAALLAIPFAGLQWWQMESIRRGRPPAWKALAWNAVATTGILAYLLLMGYLTS
ncbi:MAG: prenyltransferase [Anaerolineales bacterium]|jgi:1,4-dihydroxy-2-naphthoate octaprenyltransferase